MYLPLEVDRAAPTPLQDQIYAQLRQLIVTSWLKPDTRVIATRFLAEQLGVSRTTILLAYERLISEGYLETRPAVGTFVCSVLPNPTPEQNCAAAPVTPLQTVRRQSEIRPPIFFPEPPTPEKPAPIHFGCGLPDPTLFPLKSWKRLSQTVLDRAPAALVEHPAAAGILPLRTAIADWLAVNRGLIVGPEQVVVVSGCRQAYNIVAKMFLRPGERVVVEDPSHQGALMAFDSGGAELCRVPVDRHGMEVGALPKGEAALVYVTPSRQMPVGGTLPLDRREHLVEWARKAKAFIIEDDFDSEFRYRGVSPPTLMSLDSYGLVIYAGSFSKTLGGGLRLGYMVLPPELRNTAIAIKGLMDKGNPWIDQAVLAEFVATGEYDRHLRRIRKTYMERRDFLMSALQRHFGEVDLVGSDTGTQLTWMLPAGFPPASRICRIAWELGVGVSASVQDLPFRQFADNALYLGYARLGDRQIREGVSLLAKAIRLYQARPDDGS